MQRDRFITVAVVAAATLVMLAVPVAPHDWGDDFAMYVMQAAGFTGDQGFRGLFVPNREYDALWFSPTSYPPGFPALLAPVYAVWGLNLRALQTVMSVLLVLLGCGVYRYAHGVLRTRALAAAIALLVIFHSVSLDLKQFILSDIPCTLVLLLFLDSVERHGPRVVQGGTVIVAWLIRTAAAAALLAWLADALFAVLVARPSRRVAVRGLMAAAGTAVLMRGLSRLITDTQGYAPDANEWLTFTSPLASLAVYGDMFTYYFGALFGFAVLPLVLPVMAALCAIGAWLAWRDGRRLGLWFFAAHSALLIVYPYQLGGFRMILPLIPLVWIHAARGGLWLTRRFTISPSPRYLAAALLLMLAASQIYVFSTRVVPAAITPASPEAQELFAYLRAGIPDAALTLSAKPRAMALFARRRGTSVQPGAAAAEVERFVREHDVQFVICGAPIRHAALDAYCAAQTAPPAFRNRAFAVYRTGS